MVQHLLDPSGVTHNSATLIDHVITSKHVAVSSVRQSVGVSGHMIQVMDIDMLTVRPECQFGHFEIVIGIKLGN